MKRKNRSSSKPDKKKNSNKPGALSRANQDKPKVIDSIPTLTEKVFLSPKTLSSQSRLSLPKKYQILFLRRQERFQNLVHRVHLLIHRNRIYKINLLPLKKIMLNRQNNYKHQQIKCLYLPI